MLRIGIGSLAKRVCGVCLHQSVHVSNKKNETLLCANLIDAVKMNGVRAFHWFSVLFSFFFLAQRIPNADYRIVEWMKTQTKRIHRQNTFSAFIFSEEKMWTVWEYEICFSVLQPKMWLRNKLLLESFCWELEAFRFSFNSFQNICHCQRRTAPHATHHTLEHISIRTPPPIGIRTWRWDQRISTCGNFIITFLSFGNNSHYKYPVLPICRTEREK